MITKNIIYI